MLKKWLKPIIEEAYADGYKKGAEDIIHRMAFVYDICREKGREDAFAEAGAIDIGEIVLCKNCKHFDYAFNYCNLHKDGVEGEYFFCGEGEMDNA